MRAAAIALCLIVGAGFTPAAAVAHTLNLPIYFEENRGQVSGNARFLARGEGYSLLLAPDESRVTLKGGISLGARLAGGNPHPAIRGEYEQAGKVHYLGGNRSLTNVPTFKRVRYESVYPGIDLAYYGNQKQLEYDFIVKQGSDPNRIRMRFDGPDAITLDGQGNLVFRFRDSEIVHHKPIAYQEIDGVRREVTARYRLLPPNTIGFAIDRYDRKHALVIDPILSYATFLGGATGDDDARAVATDSAGNVYVAGKTSSTDFQTRLPLQANAGSQEPDSGLSDAFVTKLNASGTALIYSTYLGGADDDEANAIAVDSSGNVLVSGSTASASDFPTTAGAIRRTCNTAANGTCLDAFVAKLNAFGSYFFDLPRRSRRRCREGHRRRCARQCVHHRSNDIDELRDNCRGFFDR